VTPSPVCCRLVAGKTVAALADGAAQLSERDRLAASSASKVEDSGAFRDSLRSTGTALSLRSTVAALSVGVSELLEEYVGQFAIKLLPRNSMPFRDTIAASASWRVLQYELVRQSSWIESRYSRKSHKSKAFRLVPFFIEWNERVCNLSEP
jgi:hypothetical protein